MTDLPDVNTLVALHLPRRTSHKAAAEWFANTTQFATTPVTEMGLVRILMNPAVTKENPVNASTAMRVLQKLKEHPKSVFWPDNLEFDKSHFAYALTGHSQVTDLHLLDIAAARNSRLVTFDKKLAAALRPKDRKYLHLLT